jgi:uncharacterized damage-inducible protein DinB
MRPESRSAQLSSEFDRPPWPQRKFSFVHPPWMLADFVERLRGILPRLDALLLGLDDRHAYAQLEGKWSIAQNIGHLSDVEELWQERLDDLRNKRKAYAPAVGSRFQELAKRHQDRPVAETLEEFSSRRTRLIEALSKASPELQQASAFHERLQIPMRLVDCAQFYAEHDDHHALRIRKLRSMLGVDGEAGRGELSTRISPAPDPPPTPLDHPRGRPPAAGPRR